MEFEFPIYPFLWNYDDMYNLINYESNEIYTQNYDDNILYLINKFPKSKVVEVKQIIKSKEFAKNINIHTWYLSQKKIFESNNKTIKILTDSKIKFKTRINCFIFDPNDIFNISYDTNNEILKNNNKINRNSKICIIKNKNSIIPELIPSLYIHTHNIKGIFRFSPNDNSKINFNENIIDEIFYIQMDNLIVKFNVVFI